MSQAMIKRSTPKVDRSEILYLHGKEFTDPSRKKYRFKVEENHIKVVWKDDNVRWVKYDFHEVIDNLSRRSWNLT